MTSQSRAAAAATARAAHDRAEAHLAQVLEAAFRKVLGQAANDIEPAIVAAGGSGTFDSSVLHRIAGEWAKTLSEDVLPAMRAIYEMAAARLIVVGEKIPDTWAVPDHVAEEYLKHASNRIKNVSDEMFGMARQSMSEGLALGESPGELAARVRKSLSWDTPSAKAQQKVDTAIRARDKAERAAAEHYGKRLDKLSEDERRVVARARGELVKRRATLAQARQDLDKATRPYQIRAERIARTETTTAYNAGAEAGARVRQDATGETLVKEWLAFEDQHTRESHSLADGQSVPVGEPFDVGGEAMMQPGDPAGSAENTVNCRCSLLTYRSGESSLDGAVPEGESSDT